MFPLSAESKQKRMVGGTMICLSYLTRASTCFSYKEQVALFLFVSHPDYPMIGVVCEKVR